MKPLYLVLGAVGVGLAVVMMRRQGATPPLVSASPVSRVQGSIRPASAAGYTSSGLANTIGQVGGSLLSTWASSRNTGTSPPPSLATLKGLF